jgi:plastocyanin
VAFPTAESVARAFDGTKYANSGIIAKDQGFNVTFVKQGSYKFLCILHPGMEASIAVVGPTQEATTPARAEFVAQAELAEWLEAGERSSSRAVAGRSLNANGSTTWEVVNPASAGQADVMRFVPPRLQINPGDTVRWRNDTPVPHTVTFAAGATPELVLPEPQPAGPPNLVINPRVLFPVLTGPTYSGQGYVNSGFISAGPEATAGTSFSLTFTTPGSYLYICVLHADQGMAGAIEVLGAGTGGGGTSVRPPATGDGGLQDQSRAASPGFYLLALAALGVASLLLLRLRLAR